MKLLFDQNISRYLIVLLEDYFPDSNHVFELGLQTATDITIWKYALENHYTIVTQDSDFYFLTLIYDFPPKVIWLRYGNTTTQFIFNVFRKKHQIVVEFINSEQNACLELY
ncbi:MAG: DUF5615 family PIN-like protein [Bacteroidota bacterium]